MSEKPISIREFVDTFEQAIPAALQEEWDNSGLQIGFEDHPVEKVLACLEIDREVVDEAIAAEADLIITHHPLIFGGMDQLLESDPKGEVVLRLIRHEISVYSSHTPFDKVDGGNNDAVAGLLELNNIKDLGGKDVVSAAKMLAAPSELYVGRTGELRKPLRFAQVIDLVCDALSLTLDRIRVVGDLDQMIRKVGLCTGAGAEYIGQAASMGCDVFLTGDVKYHEAQDAKALGICVIDAGHYGTEKIFPAVLKIQLEKLFGEEIQVVTSTVDLDPFLVI